MDKVRLIFQSVTEIVGNNDVGLLILADEQKQRELAIPCDKAMLYQFRLRIQKAPITNILLPEILWQALKNETDAAFEIIIHDLIDGQYRTILFNTDNLTPYAMRVSDALLLAYISGIPIYIDNKLMKKQSVAYQKDRRALSIPVNTITDSMLEKALKKAIQDENYELASHLRDEIKRREELDKNE